MKHKLRVASRAWKELEEGIAWYEEQRVGLGAEFGYAVDEALSDLMTAPERWPLWQPTLPIDAGSSTAFRTFCSTRSRATS